jgi:hypothetical protein
MELLKEVAPHIERIALLFKPETAAPPKYFMPSIQAAASAVQCPVRGRFDAVGKQGRMKLAACRIPDI